MLIELEAWLGGVELVYRLVVVDGVKLISAAIGCSGKDDVAVGGRGF